MKTAAHVKGHALHQMLIPFPIGLLSAAVVADVVGRLLGDPFWWKMGAYLAIGGIATALLAAVPGFIDYLRAVPPRSSGKKRATYHMAVNLAVVALFVAAWVVRGRAEAQPGAAVLGLEIVALGLLGVGGWLGGTLVNRNFIGPEHRYAHAGKWQETTVEAQPGQSVVVGRSEELKVNQMKLVRAGGQRLVLARREEGYCAFEDRCAHKGGSLADGVMICGTVQCLWHGSQFDCATGAVKAGPAEKPIKTYHVEEANGEVRVTV